MTDVWQVIEEAPEHVSAVADLYHWSTNFKGGEGPITLFLDIIGWSEDEYGETMYDLKSASLGYVEIGKLAEALTEYADRPQDVREFVAELIAAEMED